MNNKAIGYIRVSTTGQADSGTSLEAQRSKIEAYATINELNLDILEDAGISAKSLDRPGMAKLLKLIQSRKVNMVIVCKVDRISRSVADLSRLIELFNKNKVEFVSIADSIDTTSANGRLNINLLASVNMWEREIISERTVEAMAVMRSNGKRISRYAPYGYKLNGSGVVEDIDEQKACTAIQELRQSGLSLRRIGAELERRGFCSRSGKVLSAQTINSVLKRE